MSLSKAIESGKEHREEYTGSKAIDKTCRNHGSCGWCLDNRTYGEKRMKIATEQALEEYYNEME